MLAFQPQPTHPLPSSPHARSLLRVANGYQYLCMQQLIHQGASVDQTEAHACRFPVVGGNGTEEQEEQGGCPAATEEADRPDLWREEARVEKGKSAE